MGIAVVVLGAEPHPLEQLLDVSLQGLSRCDAVEPQRITDDLADPVRGFNEA